MGYAKENACEHNPCRHISIDVIVYSFYRDVSEVGGSELPTGTPKAGKLSPFVRAHAHCTVSGCKDKLT